MRFFASAAPIAAAFAGLVMAAQAASATTVAAFTPPNGPEFLGQTVETRYRGPVQGNYNHVVGVAGLNDRNQRTEQPFRGTNGFSWRDSSTEAQTYAFSFTYYSSTGLLTSQIGGATPITFDSDADFTANALEFNLRNTTKGVRPGRGQPRQRDADSYIQVSDLVINGEAVSTVFRANQGENLFWSLTDFATDPTLTVAGTLTRYGSFDRNEQENVKFNMKAGQVSAVPLPMAGWLLIGGMATWFGVGRMARKAD
ncbi:MAG: hypothetical protein AAF763_18635 [Pseudomonadota bacterium]